MRFQGSFGGTLSLVISASYIILIVLMTALPSHFFVAAHAADENLSTVRLWLAGGVAGACLLGAIAMVVSMRLGLKSFAELEF